MRSKEVEKAIADLKLQIENEKEELPYSEECLKNKETLLSYIEELEKSYNNLLHEYTDFIEETFDNNRW